MQRIRICALKVKNQELLSNFSFFFWTYLLQTMQHARKCECEIGVYSAISKTVFFFCSDGAALIFLCVFAVCESAERRGHSV